MSIFDAYIKRVNEYIEELRHKGTLVREFDCPSDINELRKELPIKVGLGSGSGIILRGDTFIELGSPESGSCAFILWTTDASLVRDGKITLIGPDIQESSGAGFPLGQILLVRGTTLTQKEHSSLEQSQYISDQIEGYMIKSTAEHIWSRVSKEVAAKGFSFKTLGQALMIILKTQVPHVQAMEVVFITSGKEDLQQLDNIALQIKKISKDIIKETWLDRGYDLECLQNWDCKTCPDKPVCDDIKELVKIRKKKVSKSKTAPG